MKSTAFADERGESLVEILVSVAIVAIVLTVFLSALSMGSFGVSVVYKRVTAENLARAQLEYIKNYTYTVGATSYPIVAYPENYPITPENYPITIGISYWDSLTETFTSDPSVDGACGMQLITVTVSHDGEPVFTVVDYKLDR